MKKTILALSMLASMSANAIDFEIGTGTTHYKTAHDGLWYQEQYPHWLDLKAVPISVGISWKPTNTRYRVEYLHLGWFYSNSQYVADEKYYPGTTATPHGTLLGRGQIGGFAVTASRDVPLFGLPLYAEAGPYVYGHNFQVLVGDLVGGGAPVNLDISHSPAVGYIIGAGVRYSGVDIGLRYINLEAHGKVPLMVNHAYIMMFKVYF